MEADEKAIWMICLFGTCCCPLWFFLFQIHHYFDLEGTDTTKFARQYLLKSIQSCEEYIYFSLSLSYSVLIYLQSVFLSVYLQTSAHACLPKLEYIICVCCLRSRVSIASIQVTSKQMNHIQFTTLGIHFSGT